MQVRGDTSQFFYLFLYRFGSSLICFDGPFFTAKLFFLGGVYEDRGLPHPPEFRDPDWGRWQHPGKRE
jgi:hypothetical protein